MVENSAFLHAILCVSVRDRILRGHRHQPEDLKRRRGCQRRIYEVLKRRKLHESDQPVKALRRGYDHTGAGAVGTQAVWRAAG